MPVLPRSVVRGGAMINNELFTPEIVEQILRILKSGNSVELKKERDSLVVVEIQRKVKIKASAIG